MVQDARLAIRDVYDAIVELVTNSDDRYQILGVKGLVEIELGRQGKGKPSILRVRDFADGMTTDQMNRKLGRIGGRVSGIEAGKAVRGTNSRGAKDIAALGRVTFESIAEDGRMHALHFRVLLAEVVAEALCARRLQGNIEANPRDFEGMSWDDYYRHFAGMMSEFLPKAHGLMAPGV